MERQDLKEITEKLRAHLEERHEVRFAYLFGSWARGTANPLSDIDVAVYLDEESLGEDYPYGYAAELIADLMKIARTNRVDLVILNAAPPLLRFEVARYGLPLICRVAAERDQFLAEAWDEYEHMRGVLDAKIASFSQRLKAGRFGRP